MATIACLRIAVGKDVLDDVETMGPLVAKIAGAFLETTWLWPRRFGLVAPFSFVLADPRASRLDPRELQALAANLQAKLFGLRGEGEVQLLLFEGDKTEVMRFAASHLEAMRNLLDGVDDGQFSGRVCKITPDGVVSVAPAGGPIDGVPSMEELAALPPAIEPPRPAASWLGLYSPEAEAFVGAALAGPLNRRGDPAPENDDPFALERDLTGLKTLCEAANSQAHGLLLASFGFPGLVRPTLRAALKPALVAAGLPPNRARLGAIIRQVPREPSYGSLGEILRLLGPAFPVINLQTSDAQFRIDCIPADRVRGVTLALSGGDERLRLDQIRRFLGARAAYNVNRVWQAVSGVKTKAELDMCRQGRARFVTGSAVSELLREPVGELAVPAYDLPWSPGGRKPQGRGEAGRHAIV